MATRRLKIHVAPKILPKSKDQLNSTEINCEPTKLNGCQNTKPIKDTSIVEANARVHSNTTSNPQPDTSLAPPENNATPSTSQHLPQRRLRRQFKPVVPQSPKKTTAQAVVPIDRAEEQPPVLELMPPTLEPQDPIPKSSKCRRLPKSVQKPKLPPVESAAPSLEPPILEPSAPTVPPSDPSDLAPPPHIPPAAPSPCDKPAQLEDNDIPHLSPQPAAQQQPKRQRRLAHTKREDMTLVDLIQAPSPSTRSSTSRSLPQKKRKTEQLNYPSTGGDAKVPQDEQAGAQVSRKSRRLRRLEPPGCHSDSEVPSRRSSVSRERVCQTEPALPELQKEKEVPGPRLIVNDQGEFVLDEASLLLDHHQQERRRLETKKAVMDTSQTTYSSFTTKNRNHIWSPVETKRFYHALSTVGTDFNLMCNLMPQRSRRELKNKFKKEEKKNPSLIDRIINKVHLFNLENFREREASGCFDEPPAKSAGKASKPDFGIKGNARKGLKKPPKQDKILPPPEPSKKPPDKPFSIPKISIIVRAEKESEAQEDIKPPKKFFLSRSSNNPPPPDDKNGDRLKQCIAQKTSLNLSSDKYSLTCLPTAYRFRAQLDRQKVLKQLQRRCATPTVTTATAPTPPSTPVQTTPVSAAATPTNVSQSYKKAVPVTRYNLVNNASNHCIPGAQPTLNSDNRTEKQKENVQGAPVVTPTSQPMPCPKPATTLKHPVPNNGNREVLSSLQAVPIPVSEALLFNTSGRLLIMPGQTSSESGKRVLHVFFAPDCPPSAAATPS